MCVIRQLVVSSSKKSRTELKCHVDWSGTLKKAEQNCDRTYRECLAVALSDLLLKSYFEGNNLPIGLDHDEILWILNRAEATAQLAR